VTLPPVTSTSVVVAPPAVRVTPPISDHVDGRRVLLIGDSALVATTPRADGVLCGIVTDLGWDVDVEAEPGRSIAFADEVLDELLPTGWDVVGLMFGHRVELSVEDFEQRLDEILDRLSPRPVLLYTVAELDEDQVEVNRVLRSEDISRKNVVLIDWAEAIAAEEDEPLTDGGAGPTEAGAGRLALLTAAVLGPVPDAEPGACLEPVFTDDSAIEL
jgi:hypothetical protein